MKAVIAISLAGLWATSTSLSALASCLDETAAFAERVCGEISNKGSSEYISGSGDLSAEAKGLIARMLSAQAGANFDAVISSYENVVHEELAKEHANARECKIKMVKVAMAQVCPKSLDMITTPDLNSEVGADYRPLQVLLAAGRWKDADEETHRLVNWVAQREKSGPPAKADYREMPCTDLSTINNLWLRYSNGRFGFSVQRQMWDQSGKNVSVFEQTVGWQKQKYEDLYFDLRAPVGELPAWSVSRIGDLLFSRLDACGVN